MKLCLRIDCQILLAIMLFEYLQAAITRLFGVIITLIAKSFTDLTLGTVDTLEPDRAKLRSPEYLTKLFNFYDGTTENIHQI